MRQIHERIGDLALAFDHPRLTGLAQEALQALADNGAACVEHEVRHVTGIVLHLLDGLVHQGVHGLSGNEHGALGMQEMVDDMVQRVGRDIGWREVYLTLFRQLGNGELEQRLGNGHVDVDRGVTLHQRLVDQAVTIPARLVVVGFGQRNGLTYEASEGVGLWQRLTVELVNPRLRTVGTDDNQGTVLIVSLSNGWCQIEQGRATGDADDDGLVQGLCHAQGIEASRALVGDGPARDVRTLVEVMHDGRIATARTDNGMTDAVGHQQGGEYVYILLF